MKWTKAYAKRYFRKWGRSPKGKASSAKYRKSAKGRLATTKGNLRFMGLSESEVQRALNTPKQQCEICHRKDDLCYDHKGKKFRGILCRICNRNLGIFDKTTKKAGATVKYLLKWLKNKA